MKMGRTFLVFSSIAIGFLLTACHSCSEQHDPRPAQAQFNQEHKFSLEEQKLTPEGNIPAPKPVEGAGPPMSVGQAKFEQFCAACHAVNGKASDPAQMVMNPRPRDFTDAAWQSKTDDARITQVITHGGASVGLSPTMAPWGAVLSQAEIAEVTKWVRQFKGK